LHGNPQIPVGRIEPRIEYVMLFSSHPMRRASAYDVPVRKSAGNVKH